MFPVGELIMNLKLAEFCYPLKAALIYFLHNVYFETEKEMSEDFISQVWLVLELLIEDIREFVKVMQRA